MKTIKLFILIFLILVSVGFSATGAKKSFALSYGYGKFKNYNNYTPEGKAYKFTFGYRPNNLEFSASFNVRDFSDDITFANTAGKISHGDISATLLIGYWLFDRLNLHTGYTKHNIKESASGSFTSTQLNTIGTNYKLKSESQGGLTWGGELILLKIASVDLFTSYDYYNVNNRSSHQWEVMGGLRFNMSDTSSAPSSKNFFVEMFESLFKAKN